MMIFLPVNGSFHGGLDPFIPPAPTGLAPLRAPKWLVLATGLHWRRAWPWPGPWRGQTCGTPTSDTMADDGFKLQTRYRGSVALMLSAVLSSVF
ncbi:hypothetical protein PVAP13_6KG195300 [Panicum virgatum]|uniref:Uncharacterized protein n=1 Tax=Panicum virgatum TaxID=38727 RepID=A0A8T0RFA4_PANVG|nr:hypothetical protein PVAP13_6KG195300 [Panicum virgatum]